MKIPVALIIDNDCVTRWQNSALKEAAEYIDLKLIVNCKNTNNKKNLTKHFAYYVTNFLCLKNSLTKKIEYEDHHADKVDFDSIYDRGWQSIPPHIVEEIRKRQIKVVIKFGMSLLRINKNITELDILSFHHGDPETYRGRPAGFYELYDNADRVGIIVQKILNELDGGEVFARAYSKITHHSYRKTAINFFKNSKYLLRKALINYKHQKTIKVKELGKNYSLPSNLKVLVFAAKLLTRKFRRLFYGAFVQKYWNIVKFKGLPNIFEGASLSTTSGAVPTIEEQYTFYADPFFSVDGKKIRVEALNKKNGMGEIIELNSLSLINEGVILKGCHFSYPYSIYDNGGEFLIPEVASHSGPFMCNMSETNDRRQYLMGLEGYRIIDATIIFNNGFYYLFGELAENAADCLSLFYSNELKGPYAPHPDNPIVIDPKSARMGGRIIVKDKKIYRFGQDNCYGYGDKITISEIEDLSPQSYSERPVAYLSFKDAKGPHTLDLISGDAVMDFYTDKFSVLAGYRRFLAKISKRK